MSQRSQEVFSSQTKKSSLETLPGPSAALKLLEELDQGTDLNKVSRSTSTCVEPDAALEERNCADLDVYGSARLGVHIDTQVPTTCLWDALHFSCQQCHGSFWNSVVVRHVTSFGDGWPSCDFRVTVGCGRGFDDCVPSLNQMGLIGVGSSSSSSIPSGSVVILIRFAHLHHPHLVAVPVAAHISQDGLRRVVTRTLDDGQRLPDKLYMSRNSTQRPLKNSQVITVSACLFGGMPLTAAAAPAEATGLTTATTAAAAEAPATANAAAVIPVPLAAMSRRAPMLGVVEAGQSTIATVGPNFLRMLKKAFQLSQHSNGFCALAESLRTLGFPRLAERVAPLLHDCYATQADKEALFKECCRLYTLEDSGDVDATTGTSKCLKSQLNWATRMDDEQVEHWAAFVGLLLIPPAVKPEASSGMMALVPADMRPRGKRTVFRGFTMPLQDQALYSKGATFFWQAFVSASSEYSVSLKLSLDNTTPEKRPFLFHIVIDNAEDVPAVELKTVSQFPQEEELLLLPYTRFEVTEPPSMDDRGVTHVHLRPTGNPLCQAPVVATVWVDPAGFQTPDNLRIARLALLTSLPGCATFHNGHLGFIEGAAKVLGLFTSPESALEWMRQQAQRVPAVVWRIVVAGRSAKTLLERYVQACSGSPCEVLIYCSDMSKWRTYWEASPQSRTCVTADEQAVLSFLQHEEYNLFGQRFMGVEQFSQLEHEEHGLLLRVIGPVEAMRVGLQPLHYWWRTVDGGWVYGDIDWSLEELDKSGTMQHEEQMWSQFRMAPFESGPKGTPVQALTAARLSSAGNYEEALRARKLAFGDAHPNVADSLLDIASTQFVERKLEDALATFDTALQMQHACLGKEHPQTATTLRERAAVLLEQFRFDEAIAEIDKALELLLRAFGRLRSGVASTLTTMGTMLWEQARLPEALNKLEEALDVQIKVSGRHHKTVSETMLLIGNVCKAQGDFPRALEYFEGALAIDRRIHGGDNHEDIGPTLVHIGDVYTSQGDNPRALDHFERALAVDRQIHGGDDNHSVIAVTLNRIALVQESLGNFAEALKSHQRAREIHTALDSENHPSIAATLKNIGNVFLAQGDSQRAVEHYELAIERFERTLAINREHVGSDNHPELAHTLGQIGDVYQAMGRYEEALEVYQQALDIEFKVYGGAEADGNPSKTRDRGKRQGKHKKKTREPPQAAHPDIAATLVTMAKVYQVQGDYAHAIEQFQRALDIHVDHPDVSDCLNHIAMLYAEQRDYPRAMELFQRELDILTKFYGGADHTDIAKTLMQMSIFSGQLGDPEKHLEFAQRSHDMFLKLDGGNESVDLASALVLLGEVYCVQGDYQGSLDNFQRAQVMMLKNSGGTASPDVAATLEGQAVVHLKMGNRAEATRLLQESVAMLHKLTPPVPVTTTCSTEHYGGAYVVQLWYHCLTCTPAEAFLNVGCCESCAQVCHEGHDLVGPRLGQFLCDCGLGDLGCQCLLCPRQEASAASSASKQVTGKGGGKRRSKGGRRR